MPGADPNVTAAIHLEWQSLEELVKVDDSTIALRFSEPNGLAETVGLAFHGTQWPLGFERFGFYAPENRSARTRREDWRREWDSNPRYGFP